MIRSLAIVVIGCLLGAISIEPQRGRAKVEISVGTDAAYVVVTLDRAVSSFVFDPGDVVRADSVEILSPGLTFQDDKITGSAPFRRFNLRLRPVTREYDGKYPVYYTVGSGGLVFVPAFCGDLTAWRTEVTIRVGRRQVRAPAIGSIAGGYVYVGPATLVRETPELTIVADPEMPRWLIDRSSTDLVSAVRLFTRAIGVKLPRKPVLIVKNINDGTSFVGDVTPGSVTAIRFHGAQSGLSEAEIIRIQGFIRHEAFHFWNGGVASHAEGTPSWLHEGGAEYAALMAGRSSGALNDADVAQHLTSALASCKTALESEGNKPIAKLGFLSSQVRYPCGMILQWAIDLRIRQASGDRETVLDIWGKVIRRAAKKQSAAYDLPAFYTAAGITDPSHLAPLSLIVDEGGADRWGKLGAAFANLGADVATIATPETRRQTLLLHLLAQNCKGLPKGASYGFSLNGDAIKLQSPAGCGVLAGDPAITAIEGNDLSAISAATYAAAQEQCMSGKGVQVTTGDGRTLIAACAVPLKPAPKGYVVRAWNKTLRA